MRTRSADACTARGLVEQELPRERLLQSGAEGLSNQELLAILLGTGTARQTVMELAGHLLHSAGGLRGLVNWDASDLTGIQGLGPAKASHVCAAIELGRRVARLEPVEVPSICSPREAAQLLMDRLRFLKKEHFVVLHLDTKNHVIGEETISVGSLNASIVHPREVFRSALRRSAASIICAHNHPSGDPTPSREDRDVTVRLEQAGRILGIDLLDHIVIGDGRYISFQEQGML